MGGMPKGKRSTGRPRRRGVDNIKMDFREMIGGGMDWIDLTQDRYQWRVAVNTVRTFGYHKMLGSS
jgi:hypothetical protein